ncbi:MAG: hypothetical protein WC884_00560 [Candidatus Paceibacterota bacterium]
MEQGPGKIKMNREEAIAWAKASEVVWVNIQILALEAYLLREVSNKEKNEQLSQELRNLEKPTIDDLTALVEKYGLPSCDLETKSLEIFCNRNNIKIVA